MGGLEKEFRGLGFELGLEKQFKIGVKDSEVHTR